MTSLVVIAPSVSMGRFFISIIGILLRSADGTDGTVTERICGTANFEVEMYSGYAASRADVSDGLIGRNGLTR